MNGATKGLLTLPGFHQQVLDEENAWFPADSSSIEKKSPHPFLGSFHSTLRVLLVGVFPCLHFCCREHVFLFEFPDET